MQKIGNLLPEPWGIIVGIMLSLIPLIIIGIDSYKMDAVERIRLTNIGKTQVFIARVVVVSIAGGIILLIFSYFIELEEEMDFLIRVLASSTLSFLLTLLTFILVYSIFKLLSVKTIFYIELEGIEGKVRIIRKMDRKTYLLKHGKNKSIHYEAKKLLNIVIEEELISDPEDKGFMFWLYKHPVISAILLTSTLLFGIVFIEFFKMVGLGSFLYITSLLFGLVLAVAIKNQENIQRLRSSTNTNTES